MGLLSIELVFGIIGISALISAWLWETVENIQKHKVSIHLHFSLLYIFGNIMLSTYSWRVHNTIYLVLSLFLLAAIISETVYCIKTGGLKIAKRH